MEKARIITCKKADFLDEIYHLKQEIKEDAWLQKVIFSFEEGDTLLTGVLSLGDEFIIVGWYW